MIRRCVFVLLIVLGTSFVQSVRPVWEEDLAFSVIAEDVPLGHPVGTLIAIDEDGESLSYHIDDLDDDNEIDETSERDGFDYLVVDMLTGEVTISAELDYEQFTKLKVRWLVDAGPDNNVQSSTVTFYITNVNDNTPVFQGVPYSKDVNENTPVGDSVYIAEATDADTSDTIIYSLIETSGCEMEAFSINSDSGVVLVNDILDYAIEVQYVVCIRANDTSNYDDTNLVISIKDVQNLPPVFSGQPYDKEVSEDERVGEVVLRVNAFDGDRGVSPMNAIIYTLLEDVNGTFSINSDGDILIAKQLDRETDPITQLYTLEVQAKEDDDAQPENQTTSTANVYIRLTDVDDNEPRFDPDGEVNATIPELSPRGTQLDFSLEAYDLDANEAGLINLELENDDGIFYLATTTILNQGVVDIRVENSSALDFESITKISFQVKGISANESIFNVVTATVFLTNINDNTPEFSKQQYDVLLPENSESGTFVTHITATDGDVEDELTYDLLGYSNDWFNVNETTGYITVSDKADFDAERLTVYFLTCRVSDGERVSTALLNVTVTDINDNQPEFQSNTYTSSIPEYDIDEVTQRAVLTVLAVDADASINNKQLTYSILSGNDAGKFRIDPDEGTLFRNQSIDRETEGGIFNIVVQATDNGNPPLNDTAEVEIAIEDVNDHDPVFEPSVYHADILENSTSKTIVTTVKATDADVNSTGITYTVEGASIFVINGEGEISLSGTLDYEAVSSYNLTATAADRLAPYGIATCEVLVKVVDVNDEAPFFTDSTLTSEVYENATFCESLDTNDVIGLSSDCHQLAMLEAGDPDTDSYLFFSIDTVTAFDENNQQLEDIFDSQFGVENSTGIFFLQEELDRETVQRFNVRVRVKDLNAVENIADQYDEAELTITVLDINDNAPVFIDLPSTFETVETDQVDMVISVNIRAVDPDDVGDNSNVLYELIDDASGLVKINEVTGVLSVAKPIDRETNSSLYVTIRAKDQGIPVLFNDTVREIIIEDVNDNTPVFNNTLPLEASVMEDVRGSLVLTVYATDADTPEYGSVSYRISAGNSEEHFSIGSENGEITVDGELDRETQSLYDLTVVASDGTRQDNVEVTISVVDVNDNRPEFTESFPDSLSVPEVTAIGSSIATIIAEDIDDPNTNNSVVRYSLTEINMTSSFAIDPVTGEVLVSTDSLMPGSYILQCTAYDLGAPPLYSDPRNFTVSVADSFNDPPVFVRPLDDEEFFVEEDYTGFIVTAEATDTDFGEDNIVTYEFDTGLGVSDDYLDFTIHPDSGEITIDVMTDREAQSEYILSVKAVNSQSVEQVSSIVTFKVIVNDTNDNEPAYWGPGTGIKDIQTPPDAYELLCTENEREGTVVGNVPEAVDLDSALYNTIYYFLVAGNEERHFELDKVTGELTVVIPIDREETPVFDLVIRAESNPDFSPLEDTIFDPENDTQLHRVRIIVLDMNDSRPRFLKNVYSAGLLYSTTFGESISTVIAEDIDEGENAIPKYSIVSQSSYDANNNVISDTVEVFVVSEDTGVVINQVNPSKSEDSYYRVVIRATDSRNDAFFDTTDLSVYMLYEVDQVSVIFSDDPNNVKQTEEEFASLLEAIVESYGEYTDVTVNIDYLDFDYDLNGEPIANRTEMLLHVVNISNNRVVPPAYIQKAVDGALDYAEELQSYHVVSVDYIVKEEAANPLDAAQKASFALTGIFIILLLILLFGFYFTVSEYRRKLRAATAGMYDKSNVKRESLAPGTNQYATEENPMYNNAFYGVVDEDKLPTRSDETEEADEKSDAGASETQEITLEFSADDHLYDNISESKMDNNRLLSQLLVGFEKEQGEQLDVKDNLQESDMYVSDV